MKRIISIILCMAMLSSMVAMSVSADWIYDDNDNPLYGDHIDQVTTENIMTFTLDKERYNPGDTVKITVAMEEIWGDPDLEGPAPAYPDDGDWPGAYGMSAFACAVIYDTSVFTAKAYTAHNDTSTILNYDSAAMSATNLRDAKTNGAYNVMAFAPEFDADLNYGNFNGSGDLWTYNLTINADAPDGVYYLPVGPYVKTVEGGTYEPRIKFDGVGNENLFGWNGQATSFLADYIVDCTYKTNYDGFSFIADDAPEGAEEYECAYIKIVVGEDTTGKDKAAAAEVDALIRSIGDVTLNSGEVINAARVAYNALSSSARVYVTGYQVLKDAEATYKQLCDNYEAAYVDMLIASIGEVTRESAETINTARNAYKTLSDDQKAFVTKLEVLESAEAAYVDILIVAIGEVTLESTANIADTEAAYSALSDNAKCFVTQYEILKSARRELDSLTAAVKAANDLIALLQPGGSAIINYADNGTVGSYSQFNNKDDSLIHGNNPVAFSYSFDVLFNEISPVDGLSLIGGSTENDIFAGYDLVNQKFVIANTHCFGGYADVLAGTAAVYAEADYAIALNTWVDMEFVYGNDYVEIFADGVSVCKAEDLDAQGYFIYYPINNVAIYDNVEFDYNGVQESAVANFTSCGTTNWIELMPNGYPGYMVIDNAPVGSIKIDADLIAAAEAAYAVVPEKAQPFVSNYDVLVAARARYDHLTEGHSWSEEVTAPTCTNQSYTVKTCTVCGDVETEYTPALGHDLITIRTEQTCITAETEYQKCQREGCNYQSEVIEIKPAAGHTPSTDLTYIFVEPATCTEDGLVTVLCSVCEEVATEEVIPATGHTPSEDPADITDTSTCVDAGQIITKCSICGDVATVVDVPAKGHVPSTDLSYIFVEPATCSADGSVTTLCSVCGDVANYEIIPALNHMYDGEEYAWGESYIGTYPTVDSVGYHAKDCQLCGEVWEYQEIEKLHDADFMVIDGVLTEYCGESDIVRIPGNVHTIESCVFASHNSELVVIPTSVMNICSEAFIGATTTISYLGNEEGWNAINKAADWDSGATLTIKYSQLGFTGASVTLENDLKVNYKIDKTLIDNIGFENLYVVFEINGVETIVTDYEIVGKHYVFSFADISPKMMNDTINATVYATYDGTEYSADAQEYSIAKYCYNLLFFYAGDENAELRTLLVDMLNYGAACQTYTGYNTDDLANANLTAMQSSWGTATDREFVSVLDTSYDTVANASVTWKGAGLVLGDSVVMRFKLAADSIDGLTVKITSGDNEWLVDSAALEESDGAYYVYFDKLTATQMSEDVFVTVYDGDTAVSNTLRYSIESYAESMQNESNADFVNMLRAMIKYGDSAKAFAN